MKDHSLYFCDKKNGWLDGGDPFYLKVWVKLTPLERKRQFSVDIHS